MRLANGQELSAIEVQTEYYEKTHRTLPRAAGHERHAKKLLDEWRDALDALDLQEPDRLVRKVDWVAKQILIDNYRERHHLPLSHPRVALLDLAYHDVNRHGASTTSSSAPARWTAPSRRRRSIGPCGSPPRPRGPSCGGTSSATAKQKRRDYTVDWVHLKLNDQAQRTVLCKDPFRSVDERVEQLIAHM